MQVDWSCRGSTRPAPQVGTCGSIWQWTTCFSQDNIIRQTLQLIRLTDEVGEGSVSEISMLFAPTFHVGWQDRMTETEGCGGKRSKDPRIHSGIVSIPIALHNTKFFTGPSSFVDFIQTSFCRIKLNFWIMSLPKTTGRNSLNVMCWIIAIVICLASCNDSIKLILYVIMSFFKWNKPGREFHRSNEDWPGPASGLSYCARGPTGCACKSGSAARWLESHLHSRSKWLVIDNGKVLRLNFHTGIEAEQIAIFLPMGAALFRQVRLGWQEIFEAVLPHHWVHPQLTTVAGTESSNEKSNTNVGHFF